MKQLQKVLTLLLFATSFSMSQYFYYYPNDQITSNPFAMSYGVDDRLQLFVPDTGTQILFNPARALQFNRQFIVGKYDANATYFFPYYYPVIFSQSDENIRVTIERIMPPQTETYFVQTMPTIDFAFLKKDDDSYWLMQLTNFTSSTNSNGENNFTRYVSNTENHNYESKYDNDYNLSKTRLKLSRIFSLGGQSISYGIFGSYLPDTRHSISSSKEINNSITPTYKYIRTNSYSYDNKTKQPKYSFGAELSFADSVTDAVVSGNVVLGKQELISIRSSEYNSFDSSSSYTSKSNNSNSYHFSTINDPIQIDVNGFFNKKIVVASIPTNVFFSSNVTYVKGRFDLISKYSSQRKYFYGTNTPTGDTLITEAAGSVNQNNFSYSISFGLLSVFDLGNLIIQTGLIPKFYYGKSSFGQNGNAYEPDVLLMKYDQSNYGANVLLPVMFTITPSDWVTIFSGININYSLYKSRRKGNSIPFEKYYSSYNNYYSYPSQITSRQELFENTEYSSSNSLFLNRRGA